MQLLQGSYIIRSRYKLIIYGCQGTQHFEEGRNRAERDALFDKLRHIEQLKSYHIPYNSVQTILHSRIVIIFISIAS